jgi:cysteine desulfurase
VTDDRRLPLVYLDANASSPLDERAKAAMLAALSEVGNPASQHAWGRRASELVESAREECASLLGCASSCIFLTSGATESNNLALRGAVAGQRDAHIVTVATEHASILETSQVLRGHGVSTSVVGVGDDGAVDLDQFRAAIMRKTLIASVMAANSETGILNPVADAARLARDVGALVHTDATQMVGRSAVAVDSLGVDLLSLSSHKMHGPMGVGVLYANRRGRRALEPLLTGGGQERRLRSGTQNVPALAGFAEACKSAREALDRNAVERMRSLRDAFESWLTDVVASCVIVGRDSGRLPNTTCVYFPAADAVAVQQRMPNVACSVGSACSSGAPGSSHVLRAMGMSEEQAACTIRFSLSRMTTAEELRAAVTYIADAVRGARDAANPARDQLPVRFMTQSYG